MAFLPVPLVKMSGAGNTFVLVDATKSSAWLEIEERLKLKRRPLVKTICDRVLGVASDGVLFLMEGDKEADFHWDFYNADGSTAEMCGNAARCAALFAKEYLNTVTNASYKFKTGAGLVQAQVLGDDRVRVIMPEVKNYQKKKILEIDGEPYEFAFVDSGVPHLVLKIAHYSEATQLKDLARKARRHPELGLAGANVTFACKDSEGVVRAVSYERGVEDFTQACGTGAVAAAYVEFQNSQSRNIEVQMPGGSLHIHFPESSTHPLMTGEAVFVMEFQYFYEVMG